MWGGAYDVVVLVAVAERGGVGDAAVHDPALVLVLCADKVLHLRLRGDVAGGEFGLPVPVEVVRS